MKKLAVAFACLLFAFVHQSASAGFGVEPLSPQYRTHFVWPVQTPWAGEVGDLYLPNAWIRPAPDAESCLLFFPMRDTRSVLGVVCPDGRARMGHILHLPVLGFSEAASVLIFVEQNVEEVVTRVSARLTPAGLPKLKPPPH